MLYPNGHKKEAITKKCYRLVTYRRIISLQNSICAWESGHFYTTVNLGKCLMRIWTVTGNNYALRLLPHYDIIFFISSSYM